MSSEPVVDTDMFDSPQTTSTMHIVDSEDGLNTQLQDQNWWESAVSATLRVQFGSPSAQGDALALVSPHGNRCLITGSSSEVRMTHLLAKFTESKKIQRLQYTFGRKLDINSHWFCIYLRLDWFHMFNRRRFSWALIPEPVTITQIANKLREEKARRFDLGIQGPWPHYRQARWFPVTNAGTNCHFIPLGMARPGTDPIIRLKSLEDSNAPPHAHQMFMPPFEDFPILRLSAHPYAIIINAFPKLEKHIKTKVLPAPADRSYEDIKFIYDTLTNPFEESEPSPGLNAENASDFHRPRSYGRSRSTDPSDPSTRLDVDSTESSDDLDGDILDLNSLDPARIAAMTQTYLEILNQNVTKWTADVERAREEIGLAKDEDDTSPGTLQYTAEPVRDPAIVDWHDWKSEFAPWWAVLPKLRERGVLSSNDWVEIKSLPSLTGRLEGD